MGRVIKKYFWKTIRFPLLKISHFSSFRYLGLLLILLGLPSDWNESGSLLAQAQGPPSTGKGLGTITTPNGATIYVEIADSPDTRAQGLMFRPSMPPDRGMLFLFPEEGNHAFWMKNTLIPLDMLWLDEAGIIIHLESHVPICTRKDDGCPRYQAPSKSLNILELNAGMAKKLDLAVGEQLKIDIPPMSFPY